MAERAGSALVADLSNQIADLHGLEPGLGGSAAIEGAVNVRLE